MKEYLKPEAEYVSLVAEDVINNGDDIMDDYEMGLISSTFN